MVHIIMVVVVQFLQLLFQLQLHHADSGAGVSASTADDFINVLIIFPVWLDFTQAK